MSWLKNIWAVISGVLVLIGAIAIVVWLCDLAGAWLP